MTRPVVTLLPPWKWHMFDRHGNAVPEWRPYWGCEWWTWPAESRGTYCHLRLAGLEVSWIW